MTSYLIINSLLLLILFITTGFLIYQFFSVRDSKADTYVSKDNLHRIATLNWKVKALLIFAILLVIVSFSAPFIFTRPAVTSDFNFSRTGEIGDTIGGLMNPFIALTAVIVTGLAFYIQYKANFLQIELFKKSQEENKTQFQEQLNHQNKQLKLQQFESQFYEMLKLHRENITEMKINGYDFEEGVTFKKFEKVTEGRKVFVTMKTELECILSIYTKDKKLDSDGFKKCYKLFFAGLEEYEKSFPEDTSFIGLLKIARKRHEHPETENIYDNKRRKEFLSYANLNFNYKPFSGHASRLGHYFRHLYLTVKSVANSDIVTEYDDRMKYLTILRAQLSNHEQILLFYNWLGEFGASWENETHAFFTEYKMIHNLWFTNLFHDLFIENTVSDLRNKEVSNRKGNMFEVD